MAPVEKHMTRRELKRGTYIEVEGLPKNRNAKAIILLANQNGVGHIIHQEGVKMPKRLMLQFGTPYNALSMTVTAMWGKERRAFFRFRILEGEELDKWKLMEEL